MIPFTIKTASISQPSLVRPVTPITPVTPVPDSLQSAPGFTQGQKLQAIVEARLSNGNSSVLIAGQLLQMRLPENIRPGDKMELMLIAREPQFKFLLQNSATLGLSADNNPANISTTGRLLGLLTQDIVKPTASQSLTNTTPILANTPTNNTEIPALLQKSLSQSGLFYESHQAQWVIGKKTLAQLQQEPQGKIAVTAAMPALLNAEAPVHVQSLPLVQQQLTTLETGHLIWRGEIWPEQFMEWDISEHTSDDNKQEADESSSKWQTQLRLTLPKLGDITATIAFNSQDVHIKLHAATAETVELLRSNQSPLATAMVSAGLNIKAVEVHADASE